MKKKRIASKIWNVELFKKYINYFVAKESLVVFKGTNSNTQAFYSQRRHIEIFVWMMKLTALGLSIIKQPGWCMALTFKNAGLISSLHYILNLHYTYNRKSIYLLFCVHMKHHYQWCNNVLVLHRRSIVLQKIFSKKVEVKKFLEKCYYKESQNPDFSLYNVLWTKK